MGSTVVHKLAAGDRAGAADAFLMWVHPPELASRRRAERLQFLRPDDAPAPVATRPVLPALAGPHLLPRPRPRFWRLIASAFTRKAA